MPPIGLALATPEAVEPCGLLDLRQCIEFPAGQVNAMRTGAQASRAETSVAYAASILCLLAAAVCIAWFFYSAPLPRPLANDSIYKFSDWVRGVALWDYLRHNVGPSWFASLGLYLDTEIGPYPIWSYMIGYSGLALFVGCLAAVSRPSLGAPLTTLSCTVFVLLWFSVLNTAQAYGYVWRVAESGAQLAALGTGMILVRFLRSLAPAGIVGLIVLTFFFSNIHAGYVMFLTLIFVLILVDKTFVRRVGYVGILLVYLVHMFFWDGTFAAEATRFLQPGGGTPSFDQVLVAVLGLQTQVVHNIAVPLGLGLLDFVVRAVFFSAFVIAAALALVRASTRQDPDAGVFLYLGLSQFGIVALAVLGRIEAFGMDVMSFPRYASYSLTLFYAVLWYGAVTMRGGAARVLLLSTAAVGLILVGPTLSKITHIATWFDRKQSMIYSVALRGEALPLPGMRKHEQAAFLNYAIDGLTERGAAGFGRGPWTMLGPLESGAREARPLPPCGGTIRAVPQPQPSGYVVWEYRNTPQAAERADIGVVLSATGEPVALSRLTKIWDRSAMRLYVPADTGEATLYLARLGEGERAPPDMVCRIALAMG